MTQTKEQEECPLCFEQSHEPPEPHDVERACAFFKAWGLVSYGPHGDKNGTLTTADALASLAQALSDERNDRERSLVGAFMCGIAAVTAGPPSLMVAMLCTLHQPLVLDAMGYAAANGIPFVHTRPPEAEARDIAAARAKRDRKARR